MVDRYYRKLEDVENDIENAIQISGILLKLKGYDEKLDDLSKITAYENNISSNLGKINDNTNDISSNLGQINDNEINISNNSNQITDIKSLLPKSEIFKKTYIITNQSFQFTRNIIYFKLLEREIENNFIKGGKLEIDSDIYYRYNNLKGDHHRLQHEYRILDDKNNLLYKKILNKTNTSDLDFDKNVMLVKDNFYIAFNNNYNKIKIILDLSRVYRHGTGNFNLELINESFVNITYLDKNDISLKIEDNENNISSNLSKITTNIGDISANSGKINTNEGNISTNLGKINTNEGNISSNLGKINNNSSSISSNLEKINNITKIFMLKNTYFTDFNSTNESFVKEILNLDNTIDKLRTAHIHSVDMEYNFKKDDFIEIDCKLLIYHTVYENAKNNIVIYYDLYDEKVDQNKVLFRESHRYYEFPLITNKDRIIAYTKICYKVKYDVNKIKFLIHINSATRKTHLILYHHILQKGVNYISIKHYGKS